MGDPPLHIHIVGDSYEAVCFIWQSLIYKHIGLELAFVNLKGSCMLYFPGCITFVLLSFLQVLHPSLLCVRLILVFS